MGVIRINPDGEIEKPFDKPDERQDPNSEEKYRREIERYRREVPELQIVEIPQTSENDTG